MAGHADTIGKAASLDKVEQILKDNHGNIHFAYMTNSPVLTVLEPIIFEVTGSSVEEWLNTMGDEN